MKMAINYSKSLSNPLAWLLLLLVFAIVVPNICLSEDNLLKDPSFELCTPNGTFPDSGFWISAHAPGSAGAVCTTTAKYNGNNGLWAYTGPETGAYWTGPFQEIVEVDVDVDVKPGDIFTAQAWSRTPSGQPWLPGSKAVVRVRFLHDSTYLEQYDSTAVSNANSDWQLLTLTTPPAPQNITSVQFVLYLEKPQSSGQSIANFDDCSLILKTHCDQNGDGNVDKKDVISVYKTCRNNDGDAKTCIDEAKAFMDECLQ